MAAASVRLEALRDSFAEAGLPDDLVVEMLDNAPREAQAIERACAAPNLVEQKQLRELGIKVAGAADQK